MDRCEPDIERMAGEITFIWLEDILAGLSWRDRARAWMDTWRARRLPGALVAADAAATIMFTSGTKGTPKGVVLSHRNILANCARGAAVIDFTSADRVFNALPMFQAFGLTVGTLLPLLEGVPTLFT